MKDKENDSRQYPKSPITGVGAVVWKDGKILLVKRGKEPNKGKWTVPGGVVELGETLREAVKREVKEECSIDIEVGEVAEALESIERDEQGRARYHFIIIDFKASYRGGEIKAASDAEECRWVSPEEIGELEVTPGLIKVLGKVGII